MANSKSIVLVDQVLSDSRIENLLLRAGWWDTLAGMGPVVFNGDSELVPDSVERVASWQEAVATAESAGAGQIILIGNDQFFIDPTVVTGDADALSEQWDCFSQWEHCRIPLGIGARIFNLACPHIRNWTGSSQSLVAELATTDTLTIKYDSRMIASHELSVLDSRLRTGSEELYSRFADAGLSGQKGFEAAVRTHGKEFFKNDLSAPKGSMDFRLLPARYGFETKECAAFPTYIMFDVTNTCNARCIHCPQSTVMKKGTVPAHHLSPVLFKKIIDECAEHELKFVRITADGEPLLHPDLDSMIAYAVTKGAGPLGLTTNGSLMTEERAKRIIDTGLFLVDFSLDAATSETYSEIRRGLPFDKVMRNVETFTRLARDRNPELQVMVSFVRQEMNSKEEQAFTERWEPLVDKVLIRELISNVNLVDARADQDLPARWPCPHFFRRVVINYDGVLKACPVDWENKTAYAPLSETSLLEAWHSDFYVKARLEHLNNDFRTQEACKTCPDWAGSPWNLGYEKVIKNLQQKA